MTLVDRRLLRSNLNPRHLQLIIFPTEQCNFRCTYCYEDFLLGQMRVEVVDSLKQLLINRIDGINHLSIDWFGGEPLAAKRVVCEISEFAQSLSRAHGVRFQGGLTTNGYLLDIDIAHRLQELSQTNYQISLDGFGAGHDATRQLASGDGTFDRIWANLKVLRDSDLQIVVVLRIHLTPDNIESVMQLCIAVRREFLDDPRFSVFLKPIENLGGPNRDRISSLTHFDRAAAINRARKLLGLDNPSLPAAPPGNKICYASRPNSLVIRADGRVQKCTVALDADHNTVGHLRPDGTVHLNNTRMNEWMRGFISADEHDLRCPAEQFPRRHEKIIPIVFAS